MNELFGPIIGITLVLMSVFIPAAFLPGLTGKLYAQFALVIAATALISAINAATLKPTQCALWLRPTVPMEKRNAFYRGFNSVYGGLERWYVRLVAAMTRWSGAMVILALILMGGGVMDCRGLPTGFLPLEDQGYFLVSVQLPDSASLDRTQAVLAKVQQAVSPVAGVQDVVCIAGISVLDNSASLSNAGVAYVVLKDWSQRKSADQGLLGMYRALSAAVAPIEAATTSSGSTARHSGHRQFWRLLHASGIARRQRRFSEIAVANPDDRRRCEYSVRSGADEHDDPGGCAANARWQLIGRRPKHWVSRPARCFRRWRPMSDRASSVRSTSSG